MDTYPIEVINKDPFRWVQHDVVIETTRYVPSQKIGLRLSEDIGSTRYYSPVVELKMPIETVEALIIELVQVVVHAKIAKNSKEEKEIRYE